MNTFIIHYIKALRKIIKNSMQNSSLILHPIGLALVHPKTCLKKHAFKNMHPKHVESNKKLLILLSVVEKWHHMQS